MARRVLPSVWIWAVAASAAALLANGAVSSVPAPSAQLASAISAEPAIAGGAPALRRMSEAQYANSIHDIFGSDIEIPGRFEPVLREQGLLAIGDTKVAVTPSGFEQYELRAREISAQIMAVPRRAKVLDCTPKAEATFDQACARRFFQRYGRLLLRRPLNNAEMTGSLQIAKAAAASAGSFHAGIEAGLARLLVSPEFIFRFEAARRGNGRSGTLDPYSLASRLGFLLWNAPPDDGLLDAARLGELDTDAGLQREVDRLIASPKFERGVRAFFWDMFNYNQFDGLTKEQTLYPKYVSQLAKDAEEQNLRTIVRHLITENADYRDLFTTRQTYMNRRLAAVYRLPTTSSGFDGWAPYTFGPESKRQGVLSLIGFLMLDPSHEGRSSPTNRGKFVREALLCQTVPPPPANVDFALVQDTNNAQFRTARDRLQVHQENPVCAGCHALTDPLGLSMENYDAIGQYRLRENGAAIDARGELNGKPFHDLAGMQGALRDDPALTSCLAQRVTEYGIGRPLEAAEGPWLDYVRGRFTQDRFRLPALMRTVATSKGFRTVSRDTKAILAVNNTEGRRNAHLVATKRP